jgi:hypothetical protein
MNDLLSKFNSGELIGLVAAVGVLLIPLVCGTTAIIMNYLHKTHQLELKRDMLNRGMSADEIQVVLEAGSKKPQKSLQSHSNCNA